MGVVSTLLSPRAELAGLRSGDEILTIDDAPHTGDVDQDAARRLRGTAGRPCGHVRAAAATIR
jgi:C-terminal processing protease CtpA/Prc